MPLQTGKQVYVAYKMETVFGTPPGPISPATVVVGAERFRINSGSGLRLARSAISSNEVRSDGQSSIGRLGSRSVSGSYAGDLSIGSFDTLLAAALRGNWAGLVLTPSVPPVARSFTFEQHELDIDVSERFAGCRVTSMSVSLSPDGMAIITFGVVGVDMAILTGADSPYFSAPTVTTSDALVAVDATISQGGTARLDITSLEFTVDIGGATQSVIGSSKSPDVFTNNMEIKGSLSAFRPDAVRQQGFLAETTTSLVLTLRELAPSTRTIAFDIPYVKFTDFSQSLGEDNARVVTLPFMAGKPTTGNMITITSTL